MNWGSRVSDTKKEKLVQEIINYMAKSRVFDLVQVAFKDNTTEILISNLGKIQKKDQVIQFFERDYLGFWQKVSFLKAPFRILDEAGIPLINSNELTQDHQIKSWVQESIQETVRHVVEQFFRNYTVNDISFEFQLTREVQKRVLETDQFRTQQLFNENFEELKGVVLLFQSLIKEHLLDDSLAKCISNLRDNVTLFDFTFTLPNKQKFLEYGENWMNLLPTLAKSQTECLLLSQNGCYAELCEGWLEDASELTEWDLSVPFHLQAYIKHIPTCSLRLIVGNNTPAILSILQLANIDPNAPSAFFSYANKVFSTKVVEAADHVCFAECLAHVYDFVKPKMDNGYYAILDICFDSKLFELLAAQYKNNNELTKEALRSVFGEMKKDIGKLITIDFEALVEKNKLNTYRLSGACSSNYVAILQEPSCMSGFQLYEKCTYYVGDTSVQLVENDDLEWCFVHVGEYRILVSRICSGLDAQQNIVNICSLASALNKDEIEAVYAILNKIMCIRVNSI